MERETTVKCGSQYDLPKNSLSHHVEKYWINTFYEDYRDNVQNAHTDYETAAPLSCALLHKQQSEVWRFCLSAQLVFLLSKMWAF